MPSQTYNTLFLSVLAGAALVAAHGYVDRVVAGGVSYQGYIIDEFPYMKNPPKVVGWTNKATDTGFVGTKAYNNPDIICHRGATNAGRTAVVKAGSDVTLHWTTWPDSHHGPVIDYLADCGGSCENVDKKNLKFFKISAVGLLDGRRAPGVWAADRVRADGNSWTVKIPKSIKPGNYVLRHEIIALHEGFQRGGAQNYPQCVNIQITGSGTDAPAGVPATSLYKPEDAGIFFNIYRTMGSYPIPGPALYKGSN